MIKNPVILMILFFLLQLGGQIAAGYSGREVNFLNMYTLISYSVIIMRGAVWILILKVLPLTAAYPFTGIAYLLILPLSIFVFGEEPDWSQFLGAFLIFCGVMFTAFGAAKNE